MAIAYVRDLGKIRTTGTGLASSASFGTAPAVGNHVISMIGCYKGGDTTYSMTTSDNKSNSYSNAVTARDPYSGGETISNIASAKVATSSGTFTVTATASGSGVAYHTWSAAEFSGLHATTWLDRTGSNNGAIGTNALAITVTTSANLTAADELAISVWAPFSGTNHGSIAAATGYSNVFSEGNTTTYMGGAGAYKVISGGSGATHSAAWTWTSNADGVSAVIATFIPAAGGGGDVTVNLTGQSTTASAGTLGVTRDKAITGSAASVSAGSVTASPSVGLSGQTSSTATGTLAPSASVAVSGAAATASAGTLVPAVDKAIAGSAGTVAGGNIAPQTAPALAGAAIIAAAGAVVPGNAVPLSGASATGQQGTVSAGNDVTVALSGQSITASAGTIAPATNVGINGSAASTTQGTVTPGKTVAASGQSITVAAGAVAPSIVASVSGSAMNSAAGTVTPQAGSAVVVALSGQALTISQGSLTNIVYTRAPAGPGPTLIAPGTSRPPVISAARPGNINTRRPGNSSGRRS